MVSEPVSEKFGTEKSLGTGIGKIWYRKKVSEPVSEKFGTEKSTGIGIVQHFGYRHTLAYMRYGMTQGRQVSSHTSRDHLKNVKMSFSGRRGECGKEIVGFG